MHVLQTKSGLLVRLEKGQEIISTLQSVCQEQNINGGFLYGLGAALWVELGYYDLGSQEYNTKRFDELMEITNLTGNIAVADGQTQLHVHATMSDASFRAYGGHLIEGVVGGTLEVLMTNIDQAVYRKLDNEIGLKLLDL